MHVTIRLFARLRELAGGAELTRELPDGATAFDAWHALAVEFPALGDYTTVVSCAVNEEYARLTATLKDGDEVAFLPPVSGGSGTGRTSAAVEPNERSGASGSPPLDEARGALSQVEGRERVCRRVRPAFAAKRLRRGLAGARARTHAGGGGRGEGPR